MTKKKSPNDQLIVGKNMLKKYFFILLLIFALVIVIPVILTIFSKNQFLTPTTNGASQKENKDMTKKEMIRQPAVAGSFYPGNKTELSQMINDFLNQTADQSATATPRILIVPHAGYIYSGGVAAYSFKQLVGKEIKKAIIIGPSHHFSVSGLFLSGANRWQTPLGLVNLALVNSDLAKENNFVTNEEVHQSEHALELEVPFLQTVLPNIEIIPIVVGQLNTKERADFVLTLNRYLDSQTVLIVSVDLSHYHPYDEARKLDGQAIDHILNLADNGILSDEIDAPWAVATVLELAKQNGWQPKLLKYANSGDVTGDKSAVVGYAAVGFYGEIRDQRSEIRDQNNYADVEKKELLAVVRTTLEQYLKEGKTYEPATDNLKFKEKRGVFVTLTKNGQLRGCIGYIEPVVPLIEAVVDNAISAAVHDNRFSPVQASELKDIEIEISILTVPKTDTLQNIIDQKLGVVLKQGNRGATYLPQVWEDLTTPDQFFSTLCLKGGLAANCDKDKDTQFFSYKAIVFHE